MKSQFETIAAGVTTLDQARYFAAMGVDWLGFDGTLLSAVEMKTIADWVVGPKLFAEIEQDQDELLFEITHKVRLHGVCIPIQASLPSWYEGVIMRRASFPEERGMLHQSMSSILFLQINASTNIENVFQELSDICKQNICWIEYDAEKVTLHHLCEKLLLRGVVIRKVSGTVDNTDIYHHYDAIFEELEKLNESMNQ